MIELNDFYLTMQGKGRKEGNHDSVYRAFLRDIQ